MAHRVSAKRKIRCIFRPDAIWRLIFLAQFHMVIIDQISQNQLPRFSRWIKKFCIEKYCDVFKMGFAKILDFLPRLKTRSEAPTRY